MYDCYGSKHVDVLLLHVLVVCWVLSEPSVQAQGKRNWKMTSYKCIWTLKAENRLVTRCQDVQMHLVGSFLSSNWSFFWLLSCENHWWECCTDLAWALCWTSIKCRISWTEYGFVHLASRWTGHSFSVTRQVDSYLTYLPFLCIKEKKERRHEESFHALLC